MAFYDELEKWKTNQAFIDSTGNSMTYQELEIYTSELKTVIGKRTLVFSFSNNTIGSVTGYISFLKNKIVPLLLKADIEKELRNNLIEIYQPSYLYIPENMKEEFSAYHCVWEGLEFKKCLQKVCGLSDIHDYYGMVEQTGSVYMQCECGHLYASIFSDVIMRHMKDFSVCDVGEKGVIQAISVLPESYPGHSILTEDEGILLGEDDCPCGRKGKYFKVIGRIKNAEVRGCSDTYEKQ